MLNYFFKKILNVIQLKNYYKIYLSFLYHEILIVLENVYFLKKNSIIA